VTRRGSAPQFRGAPVDVVLDVRGWIEYWLGHLPGAICIPAEQLPAALEGRADITPESRILVYCAGGRRSASAAEILRVAGYRHVTDAGGIVAARQDFKP
jgi:rhodanese-related sulfurtransferase